MKSMHTKLRALGTEQANPASARIDRQSTAKIVAIINAQDATVAAAVRKETPHIALAVDLIVAALNSGGRLFYIGAGTSGRLGCLDASEIPPTYNVPSSLVQGVIAGGQRALTHATEASEDDPQLGGRDLAKRKLKSRDVVVGITASGRTPYAIGALEYARSVGAATIALACNANPPIARVADVTIAPVTGPEVIAGSTRMKAGTAQKMVLNILSTAAMVRLGHVHGNYMVNVQMKNEKLRERGLTILQEVLGIDRAAAQQRLKRAGNNLKEAVLLGESLA
jgi:N-acetylmuramic acid 6-phosphate etherase